MVTPNDQKYLSYLSCTNCLNPIFTPDSLAPATIVYKVCGTVSGSLVCNGQPITSCKEVTVLVYPPIVAKVDVPPIICQNNIPQLQAIATPASTYTFQWYSGSNGTGTVLYSGGSTYTPTAAGNFSVVATETQTGIGCNKDTANYSIAFDLTAPVITVPPPLYIECGSSGAAAAINAWLATAKAEDATKPGVCLLYTSPSPRD